MSSVGRQFFELIEDALVGFLPPDLASFNSRRSGANLKVWYGDEQHRHYEVQWVRDGDRVGLEVGFHAEYPDESRNDAAVERVLDGERAWRRTLGKTVEVGEFLGRPGGKWRRASEVWVGRGLGDSGAAVEAAERLAAYITSLEPLLR